MKKTFQYVFFIVVLVSCLAFVGSLHLGAAQSSSPTPTVASGGNGDLELIMGLDKTIYSLGEPVNLTLTITNISNQTINFTRTGYDFDFQITNDTNNLVYKWSNFQAFPDIFSITPLQAGANISTNFAWLQTCNFNTSVEGDPVSPGTYNVVGQTSPTYGIQTTPIQITIAGSSSTLTPTSTPKPTPTQSSSSTSSPAVSEFQALIILPLFVVATFVSIIFIKKMPKK